MNLLPDARKFEGISSLTYNTILPPLESRASLQREVNPSIKKFSRGKLSSIFVFEIIKMVWKMFKVNNIKVNNIFPLTCSTRNSNFSPIYIQMWKNSYLCCHCVAVFFSVALQSLYFGRKCSIKCTLPRKSLWITSFRLPIKKFHLGNYFDPEPKI